MIRFAVALAPLLLAAGAAQAQDKVRIGFVTDMSSLYSDVEGKNGALAIQMAIDDFGGKVNGKPIEVLSADHQNKADIAATKAREWLDRDKVDALADLTNSAGALAVQKLIKEKGGIAMYSGPATTRLTEDDCAENGFHWMFDT